MLSALGALSAEVSDFFVNLGARSANAAASFRPGEILPGDILSLLAGADAGSPGAIANLAQLGDRVSINGQTGAQYVQNLQITVEDGSPAAIANAVDMAGREMAASLQLSGVS